MPQREKKEVPLKAQLQEHRNLFIALACVLVVAIAGGIWYAHEQKALPAQGSTVSSQLVKTADSELSLNGVYLDQSWDEAKDGLGRELSTSDSKDGAVHHKFTDMDVVVKDDKVILFLHLYFNGQVTMVKDGNTWKISDMSAKKTGEHVE